MFSPATNSNSISIYPPNRSGKNNDHSVLEKKACNLLNSESSAKFHEGLNTLNFLILNKHPFSCIATARIINYLDKHEDKSLLNSFLNYAQQDIKESAHKFDTQQLSMLMYTLGQFDSPTNLNLTHDLVLAIHPFIESSKYEFSGRQLTMIINGLSSLKDRNHHLAGNIFRSLTSENPLESNPDFNDCMNKYSSFDKFESLKDLISYIFVLHADTANLNIRPAPKEAPF